MTELLRHYVLPHSTKLRALVFEVEPGFIFIPDGDGYWRKEISQTAGFQYDKAHKFWKDAVPPLLDSVLPLLATSPLFDTHGGWLLDPVGWGGETPVNYANGPFSLESEYLAQNLQSIKDAANLAEGQGILFVITITPQSANYRNTAYFGKYGPPWQITSEVLGRIREICDGLPHCRFYDAHQSGNHDYDSTMFVNEDHLATKGAIQLSHRLDSAIVQWLGAKSP